MTAATQSSRIRELVQALAGVQSTEDFIVFVAGSDRLLDLCGRLIEQYDQDRSAPLVREADRQCAALGVLPGVLYGEVRKVLLALNRFHDAAGDHYGVLGLKPDATTEQVKRAYRALSKKYHPDLQQGADKNAERFMAISGAYHAIMAAAADDRARTTAWRRPNPKPRGRRPRGQKVFFSAVALLVFLLAGASLYISGRHDQKVLLRQMRLNDKQAEYGIKDIPEPEHQVRPTPPSSADHAEALPRTAPEATVPPDGSPQPQPPDIPALTAYPAVPPPDPAVPLPEPRPSAPEGPIPIPAQPYSRSAAESLSADAAALAAPSGPSTEDHVETATATGEPTPPAAAALDLQERQDRIERINSSLEISSLIQRYSSLYSKRNLASFLQLFADQARENGRPLGEQTDKYRSLFARTRTIDLTIGDLTWNESRGGFRASGTFEAAYTYTDGKASEHHGRISFNLIREQGDLKIKSLNYTFE